MGKNYLTYKKKFKKILSDKTPIYNKDGEQLKILDEERWVQCYHPKDSVRREYPKYVFVSDRGNFVSVNGNNPLWMTPSSTSNGRESYKFSVKGKTKSSIGYIVVAVCFGAKTFGKASELMQKKGRNAFGKMPFDLQVHHEKGYIKTNDDAGRVHNNNPENLCILTVNVHQLFKKIPAPEATMKENLEFSKELIKRLSNETDKPVLIIGGENDNGVIREYNNQQELNETIIKNMTDMIYIKPLTDDEECIKHCWETMYDTLITHANDIYHKTGNKHFNIQVIDDTKEYDVEVVIGNPFLKI